jgi:hypothetical protein
MVGAHGGNALLRALTLACYERCSPCCSGGCMNCEVECWDCRADCLVCGNRPGSSASWAAYCSAAAQMSCRATAKAAGWSG